MEFLQQKSSKTRCRRTKEKDYLTRSIISNFLRRLVKHEKIMLFLNRETKKISITRLINQPNNGTFHVPMINEFVIFKWHISLHPKEFDELF